MARRPAELAAVARRCGPNAHSIVADMTRRGDVSCAVAEALAYFKHIDVWVNNVGKGITRPALELTDDDLDQMRLLNVKTALYGMQAVLPHFKERDSGHVINVSSVLGRMPMATFRSAYSGSKHFLNALTANARNDLAASHPGVAVSLVSPGVVRTEFGLNAVHGGPDSRSLPNSQSAAEVADVIAGVIATRATDVYTRPACGRWCSTTSGRSAPTRRRRSRTDLVEPAFGAARASPVHHAVIASSSSRARSSAVAGLGETFVTRC